MDFIKNNKITMIVATVVVAALVLTFSIVGYLSGVRDEGIDKEEGLVFAYNESLSELSSYTQKLEESLGVAEIGSERVEDILIGAVKGRYDGKMEPGTSGSMFSALQEAYPDLTATSESYARVQTLVETGRDSFNNKQSVMRDRLRDYSAWKKKGFGKSWAVKALGFPSDDLRVNIGGQTYRGQDALDKMDQVIVSTEAMEDFQTGISDPIVKRGE